MVLAPFMTYEQIRNFENGTKSPYVYLIVANSFQFPAISYYPIQLIHPFMTTIHAHTHQLALSHAHNFQVCNAENILGTEIGRNREVKGLKTQHAHRV